MGLLLFYLFLALTVSFICSLFEAVLLSTPISYINMLENEGVKRAATIKSFKENIDKPLAAILTLNTIAHTVGAAGVGAQAVIVFKSVSFGVISAVLTLLILVFSEIIPKVLGAHLWKSLIVRITPWLKFMIIISYPFVIISEYLSKLVGPKDFDNSVSREEVFAMADMATEKGEFDASENIIIQNLQKLDTIQVEDIMTPQIVVLIAPEEMTVEEFYKNKDYLHYARIPVYVGGSEDHITGYVLRQKILEQMANDNFHAKLSEFKRDVIVADEEESIMRLWERLLQEREHIAIVTDEYGSFNGIVTLEDIIESILGMEIVDETDQFTDMQQYARQKWNERREKYKHLIPPSEEHHPSEENKDS